MKTDPNSNNGQQGEPGKPRLGLRITAALMLPLLLILFIHCKSYYLEAAVILGSLCVSLWITTRLAALHGKLVKCICLLIGIAFVFCVSIISLWPCINNCDVPDNSCRNPGFRGKVLVLVPHQDDELNLIGGAIETIRTDSDLHFLYYTNGGETRAEEACRALALFGIEGNHIRSLGYGSGGWNTSHVQMYNSPKNKIVKRGRRDMTSSLPMARCYRENRTFTQGHFEEDLRDFIKEMHPDTVISVDFDFHGDHRELGLTAERVLGIIMKEDASYRPTVLKAFAYSGSWLQPPDFYGDNLKSTQYTGKDGANMEEVNCYRWDERLRIPVGKSSITRSLVGNMTARAFNEHVSQQKANTQTNEKLCNGDKVFWWRPTRNLMWEAHITAESGDAAHLNDFLLYDSDNVSDFEHKPYEHGWRPANGKGEATVTWDSPVIVREIHLFDQNNPANQVQRLIIRLSNGKEIAVGALPAGGTRVVVQTQCDEAITGFTVCIDESTGEGSGLAEVEAYAESPEHPFHVAKLQDANGDFMYDYTTTPDGNLAFSIYTWGCNGDDIRVELAPPSCNGLAVEKGENGYTLSVPQGESCILEVRDANGSVLDAARVSNPGSIMRAFRHTAREMDPVMVRLSWDSQYRYYSGLLAWLKSFICK